jgi:hypothetical protein
MNQYLIMLKYFTILIITSAFIFTASRAYSQQPRMDLISGFSQGSVTLNPVFNQCLQATKWGNCVTVATIKAAIGEFKTVKNIYNSLDTAGGLIYITFNDEVKITLSQDELKQAANLCSFNHQPNYPKYDSVVMVYASICKRALADKAFYADGHCLNTFSDAANFINSGYYTYQAYELLGLQLVPVDKTEIWNLESAIIQGRYHTTFCSYGYEDILGGNYRIVLYRMKNPIGIIPSAIQNVYRLAKRAPGPLSYLAHRGLIIHPDVDYKKKRLFAHY